MTVGQWIGAERRSGSERRTMAAERADRDRREAERRRGGVGTHHPDPTERLLAGIHAPDSLSFEPAAGTTGDQLAAAADGGALSHMPVPSNGSALVAGLAPTHEDHDAIPSAAAIAGHPVHPMVVPLPIGAFTGALVADLAWALTRDPFFARAGRLLTGAGLLTGLVAAVLGGIDFLSRGQVRSHRAAWFHAGGNAATLALGGASLALRSRRGADGIVPGGLVLSAISGLVLVVTGWLGGELSYRHRVGVSEQERSA